MKKAAASFGLFLVPSLVTNGVGALLLLPFVTYYLEPKDFGVVAILSVLTMPIGVMASACSSTVLWGNYHKLSEPERSHLVGTLCLVDIGVRLVWVTVLLIVMPWVLPGFINNFESQYYGYFLLTLLAVSLGGVWPTISALLVLQQRPRTHAACELIPWGASAVTTVLCLGIFGWKGVTLFVAPIVLNVVSSLCALFVARATISWSLSRRWLGEIWQYGAPSVPANLAEVATECVNRYLIQKLMNLSSLGLYTHSLLYRSALIGASKAATRTMAPPIIQRYSEGHSAQEFIPLLRLWYALICFFGVIFGLFGGEIIGLLTHGKFSDCGSLVSLWSLVVVGFAAGFLPNQYLMEQKRATFLALAKGISSLLGVALTLILTQLLGLHGAVIAGVVAAVVLQLAHRWWAVRLGCATEPNSHGLVTVLFVVTAILAGMNWDKNVLMRGAFLFCLLLAAGYFYRLGSRDIRVSLQGLTRI